MTVISSTVQRSRKQQGWTPQQTTCTCRYCQVIQYCATVMRAKCANFVLCLRELSKKIPLKIWASFRNVLSVISLKQRKKIHRIFKTRMKIPYQNDNSGCSMQSIAVQCAAKYPSINVPLLVNNFTHIDALLLYKICFC